MSRQCLGLLAAVLDLPVDDPIEPTNWELEEAGGLSEKRLEAEACPLPLTDFETQRLLAGMARIRNPKLQRSILDLVQELAGPVRISEP